MLMNINLRLKSKKGQSLVETALIMPVIILILTGIIDFGMMFNNYIVVSNASREGARSAAVGATDAQIKTVVNTVTSTLDKNKITISISPAGTLRKKGDEVVVTVKYDYSLITPVVSGILGGPVKMKGTAAMRVE